MYTFSPHCSMPGSIALTNRGGKDLFSILNRLKREMASKMRRPWYDLTTSHFFLDKNGVHDQKDLKQALFNFGCRDVRSWELKTLIRTFPNEYGGFDFKQFVRAMFSNDGDRRKYINLRRCDLKSSQFPMGFAVPQQQLRARLSTPGPMKIRTFDGTESARWARSIAAPPSNRIPALSESLPGYATSRGMYAWGFPRQPLARKPPPDPASMY